jgi:methionine-gamma-lyase
VARFEAAFAELEGTAESVAFASGMAAVTACLIAAGRDGRRHVVGIRPLYGGTDHILASGLLGTEVTWASADTISTSLRRDTGLVIVETPANPSLDLLDLEDVRAQTLGVPLLVDNTLATPILQRPAALGADLVLHSATKYIGGHGDVTAGVVAAGSEWARRIRQVRVITGSLLHPLAAYLLHRGLQTLPLRVRAQQENARQIAEFLSKHRDVTSVRYPALPGCDPMGLVGRQMLGPGSMIAFEVRGGKDEAVRTAGACKLVTHAVSLGGVDTLIEHPASLTHRPVAAEARPSDGMLRLSIGLEDPRDICADLDQALAIGVSSSPSATTPTTGS